MAEVASAPCDHFGGVRVEALDCFGIAAPGDDEKPQEERTIVGFATIIRLYCNRCGEPMRFIGVPKQEEKYKGAIDKRAPRLDASGYEMTVPYAPDDMCKRSTVYLLSAFSEGAR